MKWYENFFDEFYNQAYISLNRELTATEADFIQENLDLKIEDKILDIPCGFGRHAIELTGRGFDVTGIEYHSAQIQAARKAMEQEGVKFNLIQADMRHIPFENYFDKIYNFFTSFGYFDDRENEKTVEEFNKALKPGGLVLLDVINRDRLIRFFQPAIIQHLENGRIWLQENQFNPQTSRIKTRHTLINLDGSTTERDVNLRIYSVHELINIFIRKNFQILKVCDRTGNEFKLLSGRIVFIAKKKG